jgi:hypothetical protein
MELLTHNLVFGGAMDAQPLKMVGFAYKKVHSFGLNFLIISTKATFTYLTNN